MLRQTLYYCDKCGHQWIKWSNEPLGKCEYCKNQLQKVPYQYLLPGTTFLFNENKEREFNDKFVKSSPNFSQWHFDNRDNYDKKRWEEYEADQIKMAKAKQEREAAEKRKNPTVTCPYCKSTNVHKISCIGKAASIGLFGIFALPGATKQFHCKDCKADF